ncbi:MAG: sulfite exporter TauE/SafE family protein, partial [Cucumibacter sp.]
YVSVIPVVAIGIVIGFIGSLLGIGGGFMLVPALIYLLRVPGNVVIGTSLLHVLCIMAATTVLHAVSSHTVDIILAFTLMIGSVIGAQFGASAGKRLRGEQLRLLLALLVLGVAIRFAASLLIAPADPFSMAILAQGAI